MEVEEKPAALALRGWMGEGFARSPFTQATMDIWEEQMMAVISIPSAVAEEAEEVEEAEEAVMTAEAAGESEAKDRQRLVRLLA